MDVEARSIVPVILSGGNGTRLWPMSREVHPKQLLPLLAEVSLLQQTAWRVRGFGAPLLVCREEHRFVVSDQLAALGVRPDDIVLEPVAGNTAPAVMAAAMIVQRDHPDSLMLVCPTDHTVNDTDAFRSAVATAASVAASGHLVTFGVPARTAEPGRDMHGGCGRAGDLPSRTPPSVDWGQLAFASSPALSVDAAVMEQTNRAAVVAAWFSWDDVGSWSGLWRMSEHDADGKVRLGDVVSRGTRDSYLRGDGVLLATVGLRDAIVVAMKDAVLVADRSAGHEVKGIVEMLWTRGRPKHVDRRTRRLRAPARQRRT